MRRHPSTRIGLVSVAPVRSVFLDANCYLSFYRFTSVDLEELRKLVELVKSGGVRLYVTQQVKDEVARNRAQVVATSLGEATGRAPSDKYPQLLRNYDGFAELSRAHREFSTQLNDLLDVVRADAIAGKLHADELIAALFDQAKDVAEAVVADAALRRASERIVKGNPPGKGGSHGDAINWELLLEGHPDGEDLDLVSEDRDFRSPLVDAGINEFLTDEWTKRKSSQVRLYRDLAKYLAEHFPDIKVAEDVVRSRAVQALQSSPNFASTHIAVTDLDRIGTFTIDQVNQLLAAATTNTQVKWLLQDADIKAFYERLLATYESVADEEVAATVAALLQELPPGTYSGKGPGGYDYWSGEQWEPF